MSEQIGLNLELDASDYEAEAASASDATDDVSDSVDGAADSLFDLEPAGIAAGGALAGIGTAGQAALDSSRDMRDELGRAGRTIGRTQDEMVDLATSLSDATFPVEDVSGTLARLSQQGVESEDQLIELAEASDTLADATGTSAESVAENLGPAMAALGDDIEDMPDVIDAMAIAVNETVLETEDFTRVMERSRDELNELGLGTEESAGLIAAFAEETGLSGRELRREFDEALRESGGSMDEFAEITGVSEDALEDWEERLEENEGAAEDYAEVIEDNTTVMDDLRSGFDDVTLQAGQMLGPINAAAPAMQAVGSAAVVMSTINMSAVVPSLISVAAAAAPIVIPLLAIVAAVTLLYLAWENNLFGIRDIAESVFERLSGIFDTIRELIPGSVGEAIETAQDLFTRWHPLGILWDHRDDILGVFGDVRDGISDRISEAIDWLTNRAPSRFRDALLSLKDMITDVFGDMGDEVTAAFRDAWNAAIGGRGFDIPEIEIQSVEIAGETIFGGATIGGQSLRIPELGTGGWIGDIGTAALHPGERVLPPAQVTERGEASFDPSSIADGFDRSRNADMMVRLLRQLLREVESTPPPRGTRGDDPSPFA